MGSQGEGMCRRAGPAQALTPARPCWLSLPTASVPTISSWLCILSLNLGKTRSLTVGKPDDYVYSLPLPYRKMTNSRGKYVFIQQTIRKRKQILNDLWCKNDKQTNEVFLRCYYWCLPPWAYVRDTSDRPPEKGRYFTFLFFKKKIQLELTFSLLLVSGARRSG